MVRVDGADSNNRQTKVCGGQASLSPLCLAASGGSAGHTLVDVTVLQHAPHWTMSGKFLEQGMCVSTRNEFSLFASSFTLLTTHNSPPVLRRC